jgi:hypothetical protein
MEVHHWILIAIAIIGAIIYFRNKKDAAAGVVVTPAPTVPVSNNGTYGGRFTSPDKRLCIDPPGLNPVGHGECGQRYTLEGNISFTVKDNAVVGGNLDFYGYAANLSAASPIDAQGNFTFGMAHANGKARLVAGVLTGLVWEGPFEWKYGEYKFNKQ